MENTLNQITVVVIINAPVEKVWQCFTEPEHIVQWNNASDDWHTPSAQNNLTSGGMFTYRMEAKDGSFGFDFGGIYTSVIPQNEIAYTLGDGRKVNILFEKTEEGTRVIETFDPENQNSPEMQRVGWQAILDNFKKHVEMV
jgi:uncharacterized protein YndB with AHSA1/START domain